MSTTSPLRAGAGLASIDYPAGIWPVDGFTGVHDALAARVVVLEPSDAPRIVLVVLDQTSLPPEPLESIRALLARLTGTEMARVIVSVSHTFSAPHLSAVDAPSASLDPSMGSARRAVFSAVQRAAAAAVETLRDAVIGHATGRCDVSVNRDVDTPFGWWLGKADSGPVDHDVRVVRIDDRSGSPIAILANYAVQPSIMNESLAADGGRHVTADLAGAAVSRAEERLGGGAVVFFLIGAAGDQAPRVTAVRSSPGTDGVLRTVDAGADTYVAVTALGGLLGDAIVETARSVESFDEAPIVSISGHEVELPGQIPLARELITPRRSHIFAEAPAHVAPFWLLKLGPMTVACVQVELSATTGLHIVRHAPHATLVATMVNGGAKYLPDESAFDRITYEAMSSKYARGGAERLSRQILDALERGSASGSDPRNV